jgi:hypothetical protein
MLGHVKDTHRHHWFVFEKEEEFQISEIATLLIGEPGLATMEEVVCKVLSLVCERVVLEMDTVSYHPPKPVYIPEAGPGASHEYSKMRLAIELYEPTLKRVMGMH